MKDNSIKNNNQAKKDEGTLSVPASGDTKQGGTKAQDDTKLQLERSASLPADNQPDAGIHKKTYKERFLEKWNAKDTLCSECNHILKVERGITKQNLKRLVWGPPNIQDWLTLIMLIGVLFMAYQYNDETAICRDTMNHIDETCTKYCISHEQTNEIQKNISEKYSLNQEIFGNLNFTDLNSTIET